MLLKLSDLKSGTAVQSTWFNTKKKVTKCHQISHLDHPLGPKKVTTFRFKCWVLSHLQAAEPGPGRGRRRPRPQNWTKDPPGSPRAPGRGNTGSCHVNCYIWTILRQCQSWVGDLICELMKQKKKQKPPWSCDHTAVCHSLTSSNATTRGPRQSPPSPGDTLSCNGVLEVAPTRLTKTARRLANQICKLSNYISKKKILHIWYAFFSLYICVPWFCSLESSRFKTVPSAAPAGKHVHSRRRWARLPFAGRSQKFHGVLE